ncbi:MAG: AbrB/MazE/SpoVT family DNA-binding domain-containing protein [Nanoarchaeota archaeon]|nr:AbrB/MazE/SpoVT family DNA-binding domain-containing protein [Nanoarchaeota archaeon]
MKRKIIKQGHNTLTITLPSKWVKSFNLSPGDEIELKEQENGLYISTDKKDQPLATEINITGLDIPTIWKYFMAAYREGYDEIKISFNPTDTYESPYKFFNSHAVDIKYGKKSRKHTPYELIQDITNRFIGFETVEHHNNYCIIKDMAHITSKEFDLSLRRVFLLIQQMSEEMTQAIKDNTPELLKHTHDIDINVDKFHDYCIRVLNKTSFKEKRKTNLTFSILFLSEMLADEYKNVAYHIMEDMKGKKLGNLLPLSEMVSEQINKFYTLFYNFDRTKLVELSNKDLEIHFYLPELYKKKPGKKSELNDDELEIFNHFRRISKYINALIELRIEMEF